MGISQGHPSSLKGREREAGAGVAHFGDFRAQALQTDPATDFLPCPK